MKTSWLIVLAVLVAFPAARAELPSELRHTPPLPGMYSRAFAGEGHLRGISSPEGPLEVTFNTAAPDRTDHSMDVHTMYIQLHLLPEAEYKLRTTFFGAVRTTYGHLIGLERPLKSVDMTFVLLDYDGRPLGGEALLVQWVPLATTGPGGLGNVTRWETRTLGTIPLGAFWKGLRPWQQERLMELSGFLGKHRQDAPVRSMDLPSGQAHAVFGILRFVLSRIPKLWGELADIGLAYFTGIEEFERLFDGGQLTICIGDRFSHKDFRDAATRQVFRTDGAAIWRTAGK